MSVAQGNVPRHVSRHRCTSGRTVLPTRDENKEKYLLTAHQLIIANGSGEIKLSEKLKL